MLLTVQEAARKLNVSARAVYHLIEAGAVPADRTNRGFTLIRPEDIDGLEIGQDEILELVRQKKQHPFNGHRAQQEDVNRHGSRNGRTLGNES